MSLMSSLPDFLRRILRCTCGTATLEGALIVPIAISLMAGGVEFGQLFSAYGTAAKSMRSATRYLARIPRDQICGWGLVNARNLAVYGTVNPTNTTQPLIPHWVPSNVTLQLQPPGCPPGNADFVMIELRAAIPYSGSMFGAIGLANTWTLNVRHQERSIGE
jgi:TadE-like protein